MTATTSPTSPATRLAPHTPGTRGVTVRTVSGRLVNAAILGAVTFGVPFGLWRTVGSPLPHDVSMHDISSAWSMGDLAAGTVVKALACVVWAAWILVMVSVAVHVVARMRHVVVRRPRLIPAFVFSATGRWLSGVTLAASTTVMSLNPAAYGAPRGARWNLPRNRAGWPAADVHALRVGGGVL